MKISLEDDQPGYTTDKHYIANARISLDGVEQRMVRTADEERGKIRRFKSNGTGGIVVDTKGSPVIETVYGFVKIRYTPPVRTP